MGLAHRGRDWGRSKPSPEFPFRQVVFFYPNGWRKCLEDSGGTSFNWYLCAKKIHTPQGEVIEIPPETKFYEVSTGKTWVVPKVKSDTIPKEKIRLGVVPHSLTWQEVVDRGWDGHALRAEKTRCDQGPVCENIQFFFLPDVLVRSQLEGRCTLLEYARTHYPTIQQKIPDFPTREEIDAMLQKYPCVLVCRALYSYLY